ncbi:MAG: hypothetical protein HYZ63_01075 [Candidatus Andersenbacteria bacterium]|nr:hypothetical protein [Candidatus Andersenbacteria bacterium]
MSNKDQQMTAGELKEALEPVLRVISQLGGQLTFTDAQGEQFVIARKTDFEAVGAKQPADKQLPFSMARPAAKEAADTAQEVLDKINREIAMYQDRQEVAGESDDLDLMPEELEEEIQVFQVPMPPPVRVRFEPIRGDLPPELQE